MHVRIQEHLEELGITESELLNELRGYYKPSFFYIYLQGDFNINSALLSKKDRGTLVHEYTHYIQNIATYWGLYCSITRYQQLIEFKSYLNQNKEIEIPLRIDYSEALRKKMNRVRLGNGISIFNIYKLWDIDTTHKVIIEKKPINLHNINYEVIDLIITFQDHRIERIELGAHIIKESMAAMYQSLVDPDAKHRDVPYNLVKILCKQHYPNISDDIEKLICICYTSLFSMSPGAELISLLAKASENQDMDGISLFTEFIDTKTIMSKEGKRYTIVEYFDVLIDGFKKSLATNLIADLDYIDTVLDRIRLTNKWIPYLTILYDPNKLSEENIDALVGHFGIPYIQTLNNGCYFPQSTKGEQQKKESSMDVLEIIAQEAMFSYMINPKNKICPLYYMCSESEYSKEGCFGAPWEGNQCSFTIVCSPFSLNDKTITWRL